MDRELSVEDRADSRHGPLAQLLIAWSPLSLILVGYGVAGWVNASVDPTAAEPGSNRWGAPLHVAGPADLERRLLGGLPSVWLQERLAEGDPRWWDAVAALVYVTHLVAIPIATAVIWFALRHRFRAWVVAVVTFVLLGMGGYVAYPAAPPWMASERGVIGPVERISAAGWDVLHLGFVEQLTTAAQAGSNPVAAMPSLHAGSALLVALVLWGSVGNAWRVVLAAYVVLMALTLVYTGEHYVVDVLAGWATALVAAIAERVVRPRRRRRPGGSPGTSRRSSPRPTRRTSPASPRTPAAGP